MAIQYCVDRLCGSHIEVRRQRLTIDRPCIKLPFNLRTVGYRYISSAHPLSVPPPSSYAVPRSRAWPRQTPAANAPRRISVPSQAMSQQMWPAPTADRPIRGTVVVPGSKSITNRALVLAAISTRSCTISNLLGARASSLMHAALTELRLKFEHWFPITYCPLSHL